MNKYALSVASAALTAGVFMGVMACSSSATPTPLITRGTRTVQPTPNVVVPPTEMPAPVTTANPRPTNDPPVINTPTTTPLVTAHPRPVQTPPVVVTPTSTNSCGGN